MGWWGVGWWVTGAKNQPKPTVSGEGEAVERTTRWIYAPKVVVIDRDANTVTVYENYHERCESARLTDEEFDTRLAALTAWAHAAGLTSPSPTTPTT